MRDLLLLLLLICAAPTVVEGECAVCLTAFTACAGPYGGCDMDGDCTIIGGTSGYEAVCECTKTFKTCYTSSWDSALCGNFDSIYDSAHAQTCTALGLAKGILYAIIGVSLESRWHHAYHHTTMCHVTIAPAWSHHSEGGSIAGVLCCVALCIGCGALPTEFKPTCTASQCISVRNIASSEVDT